MGGKYDSNAMDGILILPSFPYSFHYMYLSKLFQLGTPSCSISGPSGANADGVLVPACH